jgi:bifunctional UDP-N-acetylglucosamine pyrophosphorylase/glucosamine-1-phosphate N-acetyltransferase
MTARTCLAIVLAAGEGTRMLSPRPKVLHEVAGRSACRRMCSRPCRRPVRRDRGGGQADHEAVAAEARAQFRRRRCSCRQNGAGAVAANGD